MFWALPRTWEWARHLTFLSHAGLETEIPQPAGLRVIRRLGKESVRRAWKEKGLDGGGAHLPGEKKQEL